MAINRVPAAANQDLKVLVPHLPGMERYLQNMLRGMEHFILSNLVKTGTTVQSLKYDEFELQPFPIPPLEEQRRIVAKVDELMALCDELEAKSEVALAAHKVLVENLLATLSNSNDASDLAPVWERVEAHFDTLFTTEDSVDLLKRTILMLAISGKLAAPEPSDEPASQLLAGWETAKATALAQGQDRRIKNAARPNEFPIPLPKHWAIESFENIFLFVDYRGNTPPKTTSGIPLITAKNVRMGYLDREPREFVAETTFKKWMTRGFPKIRDLFFTTEAPLGNICLNNIEEPFAIAQRLICLQPYGFVNTRFYMLMIMSGVMQRALDQNATGMTARGIKAAKLKPIPLPVPPGAEQQRIVAKVDELIALCDSLRVQIAEADISKKRLADAVVLEAAA